MSTWAEIMEALADQIRDELEGIIDELQVLPRRTFNPTPLCIDMYPADPSQEQSGFGDDDFDLFVTVRARSSNADSDSGQALLLALADPRSSESLRAAVLSDRDLGGKVDRVVVGPASGQRLYEDVPGQGGHLGCEWLVRCVT